MTQKICAANCLYHVEGRCRLEHRQGQGERTAICPYYTGHGASRGMI